MWVYDELTLLYVSRCDDIVLNTFDEHSITVSVSIGLIDANIMYLKIFK